MKANTEKPIKFVYDDLDTADNMASNRHQDYKHGADSKLTYGTVSDIRTNRSCGFR